MQALLLLLPEEAYLAALLVGAILVMLGFKRAGLGLFGVVIILSIFSPFVDAVSEMLPGWVVLILIPLAVISLFGKGVRDQIVAWFIIRTMLLPFRFAAWLLRGLIGGTDRR